MGVFGPVSGKQGKAAEVRVSILLLLFARIPSAADIRQARVPCLGGTMP